MYSRCTSGQLPPAPPSFSRVSRSTPRLMLAGFLVLGMVLCAAGLARAQSAPPPEPNPAAERLTQDLVGLNARYHRAGSAEQARLLNDLLALQPIASNFANSTLGKIHDDVWAIFEGMLDEV